MRMQGEWDLLDEPADRSELVTRYQTLCTAIQFFEPMGWDHPAIQQWLATNELQNCRSEWDLPASRLWVLIGALEKKLSDLQVTAQAPKIGGISPKKATYGST